MTVFSKQNHQLVESLEPALDAFQAIASIEAAYRSVILHSSIFASSPLFSACVADKLQDTVLVGGYATLANGIIELNHRVSATDTSHADDLKQALSAFVLLPKDRFAKSSRHMRKLLKELCQYASERNVSIVEGLWREVISDMVLEKCAASTTRTAARLDFQRLQQAEARSDSLVDYLIATLSETRYISRMDMAVTKQCCMSADLALVMAFRRLPKEKSLEITKALVVRVSSLIDSFKTHSTTRTWAQAIENVTDLIQVTFHFNLWFLVNFIHITLIKFCPCYFAAHCRFFSHNLLRSSNTFTSYFSRGVSCVTDTSRCPRNGACWPSCPPCRRAAS